MDLTRAEKAERMTRTGVVSTFQPLDTYRLAVALRRVGGDEANALAESIETGLDDHYDKMSGYIERILATPVEKQWRWEWIRNWLGK